MGKSSKPTIGYRHFMYLYMGESIGPNDYLAEVNIGGETAWAGEFSGSGTITINKPQLFGGDKKEGGIVGDLKIRMGEATQVPDAYLVQQVPGPWPAGRGLCTTLFNGQVGAMNPYIKLWKKRWGRFLAGWTTPVWHPELVKIGRGMNAIHIIYQAFTDKTWGRGLSPALIDETSFLASAQTIFDEELGLCLGWRRGTSIGDFIALVSSHIGGQWAFDPQIGKITYRLFRPDYVVSALTQIDESNITEMQAWHKPLLEGSINEVTVVGRDAVTNKDISATYHNAASIMAQGRVIADKRNLPGLWNDELVARVAAREAAALSSQLPRIKLKVSRDLWGIKRGDVLALSWQREGVVQMPVRVLDVDEGTRTDGSIALVLAQDFSGMAQTSYVQSNPGTWTPPNRAPTPVPAQHLYEATYRDLAGALRAADLALVDDLSGYVVSLGARPSGVAYGYELTTKVGSTLFKEVASGDFSPTAVLAAAIGPLQTAVTLSNMSDLSLVAVGSEVMIEDEIARVEAIDPVAGTMTIARGCVDSVPVLEHPAGVRVWFTDTYIGADPTEYLTGTTVDAKLLTRAPLGVLEPSLATQISTTLSQRQARPFPPGKIRVNGDAWPATSFARLAFSWTHRDRLLQADQLVDTEAGSVGPEAGVTTVIRVFSPSNALLHLATGLTGTSYSYDLDLAADTSVRIEIQSQRDGSLFSLQKHERLIACECGNKVANGNFDSAAAWTPGAGWAIAAGVATKTAGVASPMQQAIGWLPGGFIAAGLYRIKFTLSGVTAGSVWPRFSGGSDVDGVARTGNGAFADTLVSVSGNTSVALFADAAFAGSVDSVSVVRLT
jgi:hypothetical protein